MVILPDSESISKSKADLDSPGTSSQPYQPSNPDPGSDNHDGPIETVIGGEGSRLLDHAIDPGARDAPGPEQRSTVGARFHAPSAGPVRSIDVTPPLYHNCVAAIQPAPLPSIAAASPTAVALQELLIARRRAMGLASFLIASATTGTIVRHEGRRCHFPTPFYHVSPVSNDAEDLPLPFTTSPSHPTTPKTPHCLLPRLLRAQRRRRPPNTPPPRLPRPSLAPNGAEDSNNNPSSPPKGTTPGESDSESGRLNSQTKDPRSIEQGKARRRRDTRQQEQRHSRHSEFSDRVGKTRNSAWAASDLDVSREAVSSAPGCPTTHGKRITGITGPGRYGPPSRLTSGVCVDFPIVRRSAQYRGQMTSSFRAFALQNPKPSTADAEMDSDASTRAGEACPGPRAALASSSRVQATLA
ncbi:hypothetical protein DFP72DRAFT_860620 [Ephemerocybe angulata]|uniref:Uncharacterized protein n=1 Tax=Ephemerocybe angulata TaxID=980116 RepID=A0A8H6H9V3_9AGAR|nr:hypothetical protein DFP72DRAFT_860620 [Tulosesus angulatus]